MANLMWVGYIHQDGSRHVKRFFGDGDLKELVESDFVERVFAPFKAENRDRAMCFINTAMEVIKK